MKICFIPIDNRPVCWQLPKLIADCNESVELFLPPKELLGGLTTSSNIEGLYNWLTNIPNTDAMIIALDTIAYGGLVPSRRTPEDYATIKSRLEKFKPLLKTKSNKIYAFSSIMRISNNNFNIEEKDYWAKYGTKIFDYSYHTSKNGKWSAESCIAKLIPDDIINDYMATRRRNFEINKLYLEWQKENIFHTLIFSKDDCAEYGFNVDEAKELEKLNGKTMTGADEIPLTLMAKALNNSINICPIFTEDNSKQLISKYEDISVKNSVLKQLELAEINTSTINTADIILLINNFQTEQGEIVMKIDTKPFSKDLKQIIQIDNNPLIIADVRFANGADNSFTAQLLELKSNKLLGYAAWNTTANTVGSLLCMTKYIWNQNLNYKSWAKLIATRFLDDWAYQANIRQQINAPCDISKLMQPFVSKIEKFLDVKITNITYAFPWNRLFEIEINLELEVNSELNRNTFTSSRTLH